MDQTNILQKLDELLAAKNESEILEFKEAKENFSFEELGKYFSALSNEANLHNKECAWLVFGVEDKKHIIVGTNYRNDEKSLNSLKEEIGRQTSENLTFMNIYTCFKKDANGKDKRILLLQIPPAPKGIPIAFKRIHYGRDGESLVGLSVEKFERIRAQNIQSDWSAEIVKDASIDDLDGEAIKLARELFKKRNPAKAEDVDSWDDITFLNKAKITQKGKITRTALLLLGKNECEYMLSPADPKIRWILLDSKGERKSHYICGIPFLLAVDEIYSKIRILRYQYMQREGTLFPEEVDQYDAFTIREALNNCIAHQDYTKGCRINVIEADDQLTFENAGAFIPNSVEQVVKDNSPESFYRNRFLATAMTNLNMVETAGGGIYKLFQIQRKKFFPLPDYELTANSVKVTIIGKVLDLNFARQLAKNPDLSLVEILALDKVSKHKPLLDEEIKVLREKKLIEGRKPNFIIAKEVLQTAGMKAEYTKNKGMNNQYYRDLIITALRQHTTLTRKDVNDLLFDKLPDYMTEKQKNYKIGNLLGQLRNQNLIENTNSDRKPVWQLRVNYE